MTVVRVRQRGAITLPRELQEALRVKEGDALEAVAVEGGVLLKPLSAAEREAAWQRIEQAMSAARYAGPGPEPSEDELMEQVVEIVKEVRKELAQERARRR